MSFFEGCAPNLWDALTDVAYVLVFVRLKPHAGMQNALQRVVLIERALARFGISDTEFIRWPWWGTKGYATSCAKARVYKSKTVHYSTLEYT